MTSHALQPSFKTRNYQVSSLQNTLQPQRKTFNNLVQTITGPNPPPSQQIKSQKSPSQLKNTLPKGPTKAPPQLHLTQSPVQQFSKSKMVMFPGRFSLPGVNLTTPSRNKSENILNLKKLAPSQSTKLFLIHRSSGVLIPQNAQIRL